MDYGVIIAVAGSTVSIVGVMIAMMFWCRSESNAVREIQRQDRNELLELVRAIDGHSRSMASEVKDFHSRLLEIERARR
jgi:hypothetical protein